MTPAEKLVDSFWEDVKTIPAFAEFLKTQAKQDDFMFRYGWFHCSAASWTDYEFAGYPQAMREARAEIREIFSKHALSGANVDILYRIIREAA